MRTTGRVRVARLAVTRIVRARLTMSMRMTVRMPRRDITAAGSMRLLLVMRRQRRRSDILVIPSRLDDSTALRFRTRSGGTTGGARVGGRCCWQCGRVDRTGEGTRTGWRRDRAGRERSVPLLVQSIRLEFVVVRVVQRRQLGLDCGPVLPSPSRVSTCDHRSPRVIGEREGEKTHRLRPQTPQLHAPPCEPLMACFIFLSTASFSTLTRALRSCSLRPSQKSRICSRSLEGPAFAFAFVLFGC